MITEHKQRREELASRYLERMLDTPGSKKAKVRAAYEYADLMMQEGEPQQTREGENSARESI